MRHLQYEKKSRPKNHTNITNVTGLKKYLCLVLLHTGPKMFCAGPNFLSQPRFDCI